MANCSAAQAVAALHLVSYDPHLHNHDKAAQLDNNFGVLQPQQWIPQGDFDAPGSLDSPVLKHLFWGMFSKSFIEAVHSLLRSEH